MKVIVPLADGVEEMEAVIIIDVLRRAGWDVVSAGLSGGIVTASRGVRLAPDAEWAHTDPEAFDGIVLPGGGPGAERLKADAKLTEAVRAMMKAGKLVAAICAAPTVLEVAGILSGRRATCYPDMQGRLTSAEVSTDRVVIDGNLITSQGPGTAFEFALAIIAHFDGREKADTLARQMVII